MAMAMARHGMAWHGVVLAKGAGRAQGQNTFTIMSCEGDVELKWSQGCELKPAGRRGEAADPSSSCVPELELEPELELDRASPTQPNTTHTRTPISYSGPGFIIVPPCVRALILTQVSPSRDSGLRVGLDSLRNLFLLACLPS
jgi:hypothetical protein